MPHNSKKRKHHVAGTRTVLFPSAAKKSKSGRSNKGSSFKGGISAVRHKKGVGAIKKRFVSKFRRGKRGGKKGGRSNSTRLQLLKALTVPNYYQFQIENYGEGISSNYSNRITCAWLYTCALLRDNPATNVGSTIDTLGDVTHVSSTIPAQIEAQLINPAGGNAVALPNGSSAMKYYITKAKMVQEIHNTNNSPLWVRAYKVMPRSTIPNLQNLFNPIYAYGQGLGDTGIDHANRNYNNTGVSDWNQTLYHSPEFTTWFKILKCKRFLFKAGARKNFHSHLKPFEVHPAHDVVVDDSHRYNNPSSYNISFRKNEVFWLFQYASPIGITQQTFVIGNVPTGQTGGGVTSVNAGAPLQNTFMRLLLSTSIKYEYKFINDAESSNNQTVVNGLYSGTTAVAFSDVISSVPYYLSGTTAATTTVSVQTNDIQL